MYPRIIDNKRKALVSTLNEVAPNHKHLSIATGYWDLAGTQLIFERIRDYESIRLLIGQEPLLPRYAAAIGLQGVDPEFPDKDFSHDLEELSYEPAYQELVSAMKELIADGRLEVRVYKKTFLHAKCYIFGSYESDSAVGIIGSSNFTAAGLASNTELNSLEDDYRVVKFRPTNDTDDYGHLSWFDSVWDDDATVQWTGAFTQILEQSPVGDVAFSPYEMYIKTLFELYEDELVDEDLELGELNDVLYAFQQRNAQLLLKKLNKYGLAMLADSVGLGKTITAGAVLRHYVEMKNSRRVYVIAPANLTSQWSSDLARVHQLFAGFEIVSMQDSGAIERARALDKYAPVDLFIVDEAHNLRNDSGHRHKQLLGWFSDNPESDVLLLTATPINNQLTDFVNQIQLAAKGNLQSFPVVYSTTKKNEVVDFYEAVKRLSAEIKHAENRNEKPDFARINQIMRQGLRHFLVRTTRAGIEKEFGGLLASDGQVRHFPTSKVEPTPYSFSQKLVGEVNSILDGSLHLFNGLDPRTIDTDWLLEQTQRTKHPLDLARGGPEVTGVGGNAFLQAFQVLLLLGFAPYKYDTYQHRFYGKSSDEIKKFQLSSEESFRLLSQMSIHNMLRVNLLKRTESSHYALRRSLENYLKRLDEFEQFLERGFIIRFGELDAIAAEFGDEYDAAASSIAESDRIVADPEKFNIEQLKVDIGKDRKILESLFQICFAFERSDGKLEQFASLIERLANDGPAGKKVLVFSYFADTIRYLSETLPSIIEAKDFSSRSAFVTGATRSEIEGIVSRFSPSSKDYVLRDDEIDFLFATDVLSEGQNLQDCGMLVNFDLHWNPVRMIQRNGRINRLGSDYENVYIFNMHPDAKLESYLKLVSRLEQKIERIKYTVGTDQSVLGESENPIEYIDDYEEIENKQKVLDLYDSATASQVVVDSDDDAELLSMDEYVLDLRRFVRDASPEQIAKVKQIPSGKWGYFPANAQPRAALLALTRNTVVTAAGEGEIRVNIFVECDPESRYMVDVVETMTALSLIRTQPNTGSREADKFEYDRKLTCKLVTAQSKEEAATDHPVFRLSPSITRVLNHLFSALPELDLARTLPRIQTKQELKRARELFRQANQQLNSYSQIRPDTLSQFQELAIELAEGNQGRRVVKDAEVVLVYGK